MQMHQDKRDVKNKEKKGGKGRRKIAQSMG